MSSSIASIHDTARWQFCRKIQVPFFRASIINLSAIGPWPWPSEIDFTLQYKKCKIIANVYILGTGFASLSDLSLLLQLFQIHPCLNDILTDTHTRTHTRTHTHTHTHIHKSNKQLYFSKSLFVFRDSFWLSKTNTSPFEPFENVFLVAFLEWLMNQLFS